MARKSEKETGVTKKGVNLAPSKIKIELESILQKIDPVSGEGLKGELSRRGIDVEGVIGWVVFNDCLGKVCSNLDKMAAVRIGGDGKWFMVLYNRRS